MLRIWGQRVIGRTSCSRKAQVPSRRPRFCPELTELESRIVPSQAPLTPPEIASAYGFDQIKLPGGYTANGQGQTIAIIEIGYTPPSYINSSLSAFDAGDAADGLNFTLPAPPNVQEVDLSGGTDAGSEDETLLDVEWAHALAPAANIIVFEAAPGSTNAQSLANFMTAVQDATQYNGPLGQVSVVSMSYGFPENDVPANLLTTYDGILTTPANHVGITFLASSGDDGAGPQSRYGGTEPPNYPASSPNVVGVGGTTLIFPSTDTTFAYPGVATSPNGVGESAWGVGDLSYDRFDDPGGGTGGGISTLEAEPSYQVSAGLAYSNGSFNARTTPDVAFDADPQNSPVLIYDSYDTNQFGQPIGWTAVGGTSFSTPAWAALIAIADEARAADNESSLDGPTQTLPKLYQLSTNDYHDITQGSDGYSAAAGYDLATGLGTPVASRIVGDLWGQAPPVANSASYTVNANSTLTVSAVNGLLATDTDPLGEALTVSAFIQPAHGSVTVGSDGSFTYQPSTSFSGSDSFTYSILDTGTGVASTAAVHITVDEGLPDLAPYTPSGWSGPLVAATQSGNTTTTATITTSNTVYIDWAFFNQGGAPITTGFATELLLNGTEVQTWSFSGLNSGASESEININLGQLTAGTYTVTVIADYLDQVTESNKNNNTETYTFTVIPPPLPDLAPSTPSGWSGPLVVSTQSGIRTTAATITIADGVYVNWAFTNQSVTAITSGFGTELLLDGTEVQTWTFSGLGANGTESETDINLGELAAGTHTVTVITDYLNQVNESSKNNNTETYTFTVSQPDLPDLAPFTPLGWSGPLVVSTLAGDTTTATAISTSNTVYIDWAFINRGSANITSQFETELLLDGTQVQTWSATLPLYQSYYTYITDFSLGELSAGSHTVTVIANYLNQVTESNSDNNTETFTFTVTPPGLPDLAPYTPGGWSAPLVVTTRSGSTVTAATVTTANTVYIDWAFLNQGSSAITTNYQTELLLDGTQVHTWAADVPLNPNFFTFITGYSLGQLSAGSHTVTVITDYLDQVNESN
ncbi:MAG TPA: CARDB domain-containing protein, partial [Gemmataceae bacterium]|nr:CARDB domain-containing protein [Gemmataceae bacterium]